MKYIYIIIYGLCNLEIRSEKSLHTPFKVHVMTITECKYILIMLGKRSRLYGNCVFASTLKVTVFKLDAHCQMMENE